MSENKPANYWEAYKILKKKLFVKRFSRIPLLTFSETYTQVNAYNLALFSILAYSDEEGVIDYFKKINKKGSRNFIANKGKRSESPFVISSEFDESFEINRDDIVSTGQDTQFFIARNSKQILISIRGTESPRDWLKDANAEEVDFKEGTGQVHEGFYNGFQYVKEHIGKYFELNLSKDTEIIITGHSLGGAIATLTAAYIRDKFDTKKVMLYTYGSPRVGDKTFAEYYAKTKKIVYFRVVNDNDLVTMVPLPGMDLKPHLLPLAGANSFFLPMTLLDFDKDPYMHTGKLVHIHKLTNQSAAISPGYSKLTYALLFLSPALLAGKITLDGLLKAKESITDHFMGSYFPILENDLKKTIKAYLATENVDLKDDREGILALEEEIRKLNEKKSDILENGDYVTKDYEASKIDVAITHKNFDLTNLKKWVQHFEESNKDKKYFLKKLISTTSNPVIEDEFEYHSND